MPKIKLTVVLKALKLSKTVSRYVHTQTKSHILTKKSTKRKRNLRKTSVADTTNVKQIKKLIPYK